MKLRDTLLALHLEVLVLQLRLLMQAQSHAQQIELAAASKGSP